MLKFNISNRNILALIVIVTPFIPIFGPIWLIDYSAKCRNNIIKRELRFAGIAYCILQLGLILSLIIPSIVRDKHKVGISHLESNMISIKIALEKYYFATQAYPENIDSLINKGFISGYPYNPFSEIKEPMRHIEFGMEQSEGNFTYIPIKIDNKYQGYYLFAYGWEKDRNSGYDVNGDSKADSVIIVLSGAGSDKIKAKMPSLKELLSKKQNHDDDRP